MRYTTTDGPKKPLNAIQDGSLGDIMGIAGKHRNSANALVDKRATDNGSGLIRDQVFDVEDCPGKIVHV